MDEKVTPSVLASNCSVPENVPVTRIVAVFVDSVGLLYRVNGMQALVVPQVDPLAVMFPVELI